MTGAHPAEPMPTRQRAVSLRAFLTRLAWLCVLPMFLSAAWFGHAHIRSLQSRMDEDIADRLHNAVTAVDRIVLSQIASLQVLAASPLLDDPGRLKEFHREALGFLDAFGCHVILADASRRMLLNTRVPYGDPLPEPPRPNGYGPAQAAPEKGIPSVGDLTFGPVEREPIVVATVPVTRDGRTEHLLMSAIPTRLFRQHLEEVALPREWALTLLDGNGDEIARGGLPEEGERSAGAGDVRRFRKRSPVSDWSMVIEAPAAAYRAPAIKGALALFTAILSFTLVSVLAGRLAGRRLTRAVEGLAETGEARRKAEEALESSEREYRRLSSQFHGLLDAIPDSLLLLDKNLAILWANRAAVEAVGGTLERLGGRSCHEAWHRSEKPCGSCPASRSFTSGRPIAEILKGDDGRTWDVRTVPLFDAAGRVESVIALKRDITGHARLEAQYLQAQKMESIGTLAGGVAHDFNNILTVIIGYGHVALMDMKEDDPQRHNVVNMLEAAERAAHLTRELLLFSRRQPVERRPVDLNDVVRKAEKFLRRLIGEDIECRLVLGDGGAPEAAGGIGTPREERLTVLADPLQLEQVLMNLATNARDAMPRGGTLSLKTSRVVLGEDFVAAHGFGKPGAYALLTVSDTGKGMDGETIKRIFEPFFTTKDVGNGTGLGLAVVYGIVKQHEGFINAYSEPGHGTRFRIYLPLLEKAPQDAAPDRPRETPRGGTETILVAEDDGALREIAKTVLTMHGYTVVEAQDGEEAVRKFLEHRDAVRLLLMDLVMPKMDGKEACEEIRKIRPDVKVVFSTGYAPDHLRRKIQLEGTFHLIQKPVSPSELLRKVRSVLDGE